MQRRPIAARKVVVAVLGLQLIPLLLFPPESFSVNSQEWWLPVLLTVMILAALLELLVRGSRKVWPWHLMIVMRSSRWKALPLSQARSKSSTSSP